MTRYMAVLITVIMSSLCLATENAECDGNDKLHMFLTINSLAWVSDRVITQRRIEINWYGGQPRDGDIVALFDRDPSNFTSFKPLDSASVSGHPSGYFITNIQLPIYQFMESNLTSKCLGYWAAYLEGGVKLRASACFKSQPTWMRDNKDTLQNLPLSEVAIPGSHDAGTYNRYNGKKEDHIIFRHVTAQEENIFNQLVYGIRHLDLRIGYHPFTEEKFWIQHDFKINNTLSEILRDIRRFVDGTSHEIVILDLHTFTYFDNLNSQNVHKKFINFLLQELESYMVPTSVGTMGTLGQLWATGKRVLVAYNSPERIDNPLFLWQGVKQEWGNKQTLDTLYSYFKSFFDSGAVPSGSLWSSQVEMTPTTFTSIFYIKVGLRELANQVNRNLTVWFRDQWWRQATMVATDYILGNNMVEVSIQNNIKKVRCPHPQRTSSNVNV